MRHWLIVSLFVLVVLGGAVFVLPVKAETIYQNAGGLQTPAVSICIVANGSMDNCSTNTSYQDFSVLQELDIENGVSITSASIWRRTSGSSTTRTVTVTGYLMNGTHKVATSTNNVTYQWDTNEQSEVKLNFTPYLVSPSTPITGVMFYSDEADGGGNDTYMRYALTENEYPPDYMNPAYFGSFYSSQEPNNFFSSYSSIGNYRDLAITIRVSDLPTDLEITYPTNNSTVSDLPLYITGTCEYPLDLEIYNGTSYASSTYAFGATVSCTADTFSYPWNPVQGYWNVIASSTDAVDGILFYYYAASTSTVQYLDDTQDFLDDMIGSWSCEIPYLTWDPCNAVSRFIQGTKDALGRIPTAFYNVISTTKPYSYLTEIQTALSPTSHTTSTPTVAFTVPTTTAFVNAGIDFSTTLFDSTTFTDVLPQSMYTTIRPYINLILYLGFIAYVWFLRKRII